MKLHCFKATGDVDRGTELFDYFTKIDDQVLQIREIIGARQKPRRVNVQPTIRLSKQGTVELLEYDETFEGIIKSYQDRFPSFDEAMLT
jgi:dipeptidyl-peptidase-3